MHCDDGGARVLAVAAMTTAMKTATKLATKLASKGVSALECPLFPI